MLRNPLTRAFGLVLGYIVCFWSVRLIALTFVTYTYVRSSEQNSGTLQKIGDVVQANQVLTHGLAALIFVALLHGLQPLTRTQFNRVFDLKALKACFAPNALNGLILTAVLILGAMLGGHMSYLGVYMRFDEVALAITSSGVFVGGLFLVTVVEEYILREALEPRLSEHMSSLAAVAVSSVVFLVIKAIQFDLAWLDAVNLVLLNLTLSMIARNEKNFMASASFYATFLTFVHVFFGLPFMGQDMPGIFLLRASSDNSLGNLLSGGAAGPESGVVLTVLLVIYLYLPQIRSKKIEV